MSFGFPLGLLALFGWLPLAAAYFLRRRQKVRRVSALFLWETPNQRAQAGPRLERFSREASLLLEALAIAAAALYLADLRFGAAREQRHAVLVVDGSLSMAARRADGKTVADRVRAEAARRLAEERAEQVTVIESALEPRILAGPQATRASALRALDDWRPWGGAHDPTEALRRAVEIAGPDRRIQFLTDGARPPSASVAPAVEWVALGEPLPNAAFVAAQRRDEGDRAEVTVRVASFGAPPDALTVTFSGPPLDPSRPGGAQRQERVALSPDGSAVVRARFQNAGPIEVSLPSDALPEDGRVTLIPATLPTRSVVVLSGLDSADQRAVEKALRVSPGVVLAGPGAPADLAIGPRGTRAQLTIGAPGTQRTLVGPFFAEKHHPALEDVNLSGVVWTAGENPPGRPLITAGEVVLVSEEEGGALHLNLALSRSNVQRTPAWPILLGNVLRLPRFARAGFPRKHLTLGDEVPVVTEAGGRYALSGPAGERPIFAAGWVNLPPPGPPGEYVLLGNGAPIDRLQVLPIDPRESDLRSRGSATVPARVASASVSGAAFHRRAAWPIFVLLLLLAVDFWMTGRLSLVDAQRVEGRERS